MQVITFDIFKSQELEEVINKTYKIIVSDEVSYFYKYYAVFIPLDFFERPYFCKRMTSRVVTGLCRRSSRYITKKRNSNPFIFSISAIFHFVNVNSYRITIQYNNIVRYVSHICKLHSSHVISLPVCYVYANVVR